MVQDALNESKQIKAELSRKVLHANSDLAARMEAEGILIEYSTEKDYLRITIGKPRASIGLAWPDEMYSVVLFDPDSYEIQALEAPFFLETLGNKKPKKEFWEVVMGLIKEGRTSVYIPPRAERERTEQAMQNLVGT